MNKGRPHFLMGLPRSGKSTLAQKWRAEPGSRPRVVLSGDDFRTALHGHVYVPQAEGTVFAMMDVAARALLAGGHDVLVDETCTTEATLLRYLRLDLDCVPLLVDTPAQECRRRAVATGKTYLLGVIDRMEKQLQELLANFPDTILRLRAYARARLEQDNFC